MLAHWGMWPGQLEFDLFDSSGGAESELLNDQAHTFNPRYAENDYCCFFKMAKGSAHMHYNVYRLQTKQSAH